MTAENSDRARRRDERSVAEQAGDWVAELADGGPRERAAFLEWVTESPRHVEEYLLAATLYRTLDRVDSRRQIDLTELLADAALNVHSFKAPAADAPQTPRRPRNKRRWQLASAAAFAAAGAVALAWWIAPRDHLTYSTGIGELRSIELADGSVVDLNTQSRVEIAFSKQARSVRLLSGEALFKVESDLERPFVVYADTAVIQALGTQFNVYRRPGETAVSVIEGAVQISSRGPALVQAPAGKSSDGASATGPVSAQLTAGKGVRISSSGLLEPVIPVDPVKVTAWRERRLVFVDDRLADIVAEFNRYNASPHLRVDGAYAQTRELTGVFDAGDPQSLVQFLENLGEFSVDTTAGEIVIRQR